MYKIITLIMLTTVLILSSCGQVSNPTVNTNNAVNPTPSDESGAMTDDSSVIIVDGNTATIEAGVEGWSTTWGELDL